MRMADLARSTTAWWNRSPLVQLEHDNYHHQSGSNIDVHLLKEPLKQMTMINMILAVTPSTPRLVRRNAETF